MIEIEKLHKIILDRLYFLRTCSDGEMRDGDTAREVARDLINLIEGRQ